MKGYYLYCIRPRTIPSKREVRGREKTEDENSLGRGVDKKGKVYVIPLDDIEAVVSEVPFGDFSSEEFQRRAVEDLKWIKEKAELHEKVIEKAMGEEKDASVIPMKFGTVFKSVEKLNSVLQSNYSKFKNILKRLRGKQEWSVKVYLKSPEALREGLRERNPELQSLEDSLGSIPEGLAYFKEKELRDMFEESFREALAGWREMFFSRLGEFALSSSRGKILEEELTGSPHQMILNGVFLVPREAFEDFRVRIDELASEARPRGFHFEYSGPWPPYNFV